MWSSPLVGAAAARVPFAMRCCMVKMAETGWKGLESSVAVTLFARGPTVGGQASKPLNFHFDETFA